MTREELDSHGPLHTLSRVQKLATGFLAIAGGVVTLASSKDFIDALPVLGVIGLSVVLIMWVNNRMKEMGDVAAKAVAGESRCNENLHQRDKLLAILYYDLRSRSGQHRRPTPDLEKIVGPEVARAVRDAAELLDLTTGTFQRPDPQGDG